MNMIRSASDHTARACDAILSDFIDTFFSTPGTWDEKADELGLHTIESSEEFEDSKPWLRELFRLVCAAPKLKGQEAKLYAEGYKRVQRNDGPGEDSDLCLTYTKFADAPGGPNWSKARRLDEKDWGNTLKTDEAVHLDIKGDGGTIYLRFRVGPMKAPRLINEQIVDPKDWEGVL